MKALPYIVILIFLLIIILQNKGCNTPVSKSDTTVVIKYVHITDTVYKSTPPIVKIKKDTVWIKSPENTPDTTYKGLLEQYNTLGNRFFEKKLYSIKYQIADYGTIIVHDSVSENSITESYITTNLNIPVTTITVEKTVPYRALYMGPEITGNKSLPINGVYGRALFKTKKDNIYSISGGWNGEIQFGGGIYWRINK